MHFFVQMLRYTDDLVRKADNVIAFELAKV